MVEGVKMDEWAIRAAGSDAHQSLLMRLSGLQDTAQRESAHDNDFESWQISRIGSRKVKDVLVEDDRMVNADRFGGSMAI